MKGLRELKPSLEQAIHRHGGIGYDPPLDKVYECVCHPIKGERVLCHECLHEKFSQSPLCRMRKKCTY